jgi:hypothetical protein
MVPDTRLLSWGDLNTTFTKDKGALVEASFKRPEMVILGL